MFKLEIEKGLPFGRLVSNTVWIVQILWRTRIQNTNAFLEFIVFQLGGLKHVSC